MVSENRDGFVVMTVVVGGVEEEILDPTEIAIEADLFAGVAKRLRWASFIFLRLREIEKLGGFGFEFVDKVQGDTMVNHFEEAVIFTGFDKVGSGVGVVHVYYWDYVSVQGAYRLACLEPIEMLLGRWGQENHGFCVVFESGCVWF